MFTGLIRARSKLVRKRTGRRGSLVMVLDRPEDWVELDIGDSIAVHGTCLTITALNGQTMDFEATEETRNRCRFDSLPTGALLHVFSLPELIAFTYGILRWMNPFCLSLHPEAQWPLMA